MDCLVETGVNGLAVDDIVATTFNLIFRPTC